ANLSYEQDVVPCRCKVLDSDFLNIIPGQFLVVVAQTVAAHPDWTELNDFAFLKLLHRRRTKSFGDFRLNRSSEFTYLINLVIEFQFSIIFGLDAILLPRRHYR